MISSNIISRRKARSRKVYPRNHIEQSGARPEKGSRKYPWERLIRRRATIEWMSYGYLSRDPVVPIGVVFWHRRYGEACLVFTAELPAYRKIDALRDVSEDVVERYESFRMQTRAQAD
jgi:hypothetical protein